MKHFCDQHCLLRFYCQQNEPNMSTQKGPENLHYGESCAGAGSSSPCSLSLLRSAIRAAGVSRLTAASTVSLGEASAGCCSLFYSVLKI